MSCCFVCRFVAVLLRLGGQDDDLRSNQANTTTNVFNRKKQLSEQFAREREHMLREAEIKRRQAGSASAKFVRLDDLEKDGQGMEQVDESVRCATSHFAFGGMRARKERLSLLCHPKPQYTGIGLSPLRTLLCLVWVVWLAGWLADWLTG